MLSWVKGFLWIYFYMIIELYYVLFYCGVIGINFKNG